MEICVIDVETTGLNVVGSDRVVELGMVRLNEDWEVVGTFETLINPLRSMGATRVHGITDRMVRNAPTFKEVVPDIFSMIDGAVVAAHNASFDCSAIETEIVRCGGRLSLRPAVCTLQLAKQLLYDLPSRKLGYLCRRFDINTGLMHSALSDALSAGQLLRVLFEEFGGHERIEQVSPIKARSPSKRDNPVEPVTRAEVA